MAEEEDVITSNEEGNVENQDVNQKINNIDNNNEQEIKPNDISNNEQEEPVEYDENEPMDSYIGEKNEDGEMHGYGVYTYASGDVYKGFFANDMMNGKGTFTCANTDEYVGKYYVLIGYHRHCR